MEIGVVVHGPQIVDTGYAKKIINLLKSYGNVESKLGGTMGRTAVIDAELENTIDISRKLLPSESVKSFNQKDIVFLLNYGKSSTTGHAFGFKVYNKSDKAKMIQIERPGEEDGTLVIWDEDLINIGKKVAKELKIDIVFPKDIENKLFPKFKTQDPKSHSYLINEDETNRIKKDKSKIIQRQIAGVNANENIFINGVVVGESISKELILVSENNKLLDIKGGKIKEHGVEKLGEFDLTTAIVKTGLLRRSKVKARIIDRENLKSTNNQSSSLVYNANSLVYKNSALYDKNPNHLKVAFVDHAAEDIYSVKDSDLVVCVGDDTTLVVSDILYRFSVPIIGITDGDLDKVVESGYKLPQSAIIELKSGWDDKIGLKVFKTIFKNNKLIKINDKTQLLADIMDIVKEHDCFVSLSLY